MNIKICLLSVVSLVASFAFSATVTTTDKIMSVVLTDGETYRLTSAECSDINNTRVTNVVVTGSGTLTVSANIPSYKGEIHLESGVTLLQDIAKGLGYPNPKFTVYVASGASLDINIPSSVQVHHKTVFASGSHFNMLRSSISIFGEMVLEDDLTLGGTSAPNLVGTLTMNGHTLTCPNGIDTINPKATDNSGVVYMSKKNATIYGPYNTDQFDENFTLRLAEGAIYRYQTGGKLADDYVNICKWKLVGDGDMTFQANFGKSAYYGPITLPKTATFSTYGSNVTTDKRLDFYGKITCGTFYHFHSAIWPIYLHTTNDIDQITGLDSGGFLWAQYRQSLPSDLSKLLMPNSASYRQGVVIAGTTAERPGWDPTDLEAFCQHFKNKDCWFGIGALSNEVATISFPDNGGLLDDFSFTFETWGGGKSLILLGNGAYANVTAHDDMYAHARPLTFPPIGHVNPTVSKNFYCVPASGRMRLEQFGLVTLRSTIDGVVFPRFNGLGPARLCVSTGTTASVTQHLRVGYRLESTATFEVDGGSVTNDLQVMLPMSVNDATAGGILRGGTWYSKGQVNVAYGPRDLGYLEISGGQFICNILRAGSSASNTAVPCYGQVFVKGGELRRPGSHYGSPFTIGNGGTGVYYQVSGTAYFENGLGVPRSFGAANQENGNGVLTLAGGSLTSDVSVVVADMINSRGQVNLNGGTLVAPMIYRTAGQPVQGAGAYTWTSGVGYNTKANFTFNGGTFRAKQDKATIFGRVPTARGQAGAPDKLFVYSNGMTIDSAGFNVSVDTPIEAPTGKGVSTITLPNGGAKLTGYLVAPYVLIEGDGEGATAVADFDSVTEEVKGVIITCPGWGYTTATAKLVWGQLTFATRAIVDCTVTLADNVSGGLTKIGAGTLSLKVANTYAGTTTVNEGTLALDVAGALPAGSSVVVNGGALSAAAGVEYPANFSVNLSNYDTTGATQTYVIATNWTRDIPTSTGCADGWRLVVRGGNLVYQKVRGLVIMFN